MTFGVGKDQDQNQQNQQNQNQQDQQYASQGPTGPGVHNQTFHQASDQGPSQRAGMSSIGQHLGSSFRRGAIADQTMSFKENIDRMLSKTTIADLEMSALILDSGRFGLHYSALVFAGRRKVGSRHIVMAYTAILEGSNTPPPTQQRNFYGQQVNIVLTAMEAWDEQTWSYVQDMLRNHYGNEVEIYSAGAMCIPSETDPEDTRMLNDILANAEHALRSMYEQMFPEQFGFFSIREIFDSRRDRILCQFTYNGKDSEDTVGNPLRSDVTMRMVSSDRFQADGFSAFQHRSSKQIAELTGFVDLLYYPEPSQPVSPYMPTQQQQPRLFLPQVVITGVQSVEYRLTPETFLLAISTSQLLAHNYAWVNQFANMGKDNVHDIGGIGYRMPNPQDPNAHPQAIDTNSSNFDINELFKMVQATCHPQPVFSIDCEDVGANSWLTGDLIEAAYGSADAANNIVQAANNLTGGCFARYWGGGHVVVPKNQEHNKVHLGTYEDHGNTRRDIREVDTLSMLNFFGHSDMSEIARWEATFNDMNTPVEFRLDQRLKIMEQLLGSRMRIRGFAERLTFTGEFLSALVQGCHDAGLAVDHDGLQTSFGQNHHVGNTILGQFATQANPGALVSQSGPVNFANRRPFTGGRW